MDDLKIGVQAGTQAAASNATAAAPEADEAFAAILASAMPGTPQDLAQRLLMEVAEPMGLSFAPEHQADDAAKVAAALQAISAAGPRDALEAMLAAQMAAVHMAAMRATMRAARCADHPEIEALYLRQATRLMGLFARQAEVLRRLRERVAEPSVGARHPEVMAEANAPVRKTKGGSRRRGDISVERQSAPGGAAPEATNGLRHRLAGAAPAARNGRRVNGHRASDMPANDGP